MDERQFDGVTQLTGIMGELAQQFCSRHRADMAKRAGFDRDRDGIRRGEADDTLGEYRHDVSFFDARAVIEAGVVGGLTGIEMVDAVHD